MLQQLKQNYAPLEWSSNYDSGGDYKLVDVPRGSLYNSLSRKIAGSFNLGVTRIARVENIYLYTRYLIRKAEYELEGHTRVEELFHDTSEYNVVSIVSENLDRRLARRVKYGRGVSFSPNPAYANRQSSRNNGRNRAMIVTDVLVRSTQTVNCCNTLPRDGHDTTVGNFGQVYVKYYDDEFYPKYVIYYTNR